MDGSRNRLERVTRVTLERLNELFELREKLSRAMETRLSLESVACPGAQVLTGMPHATGVKDKVGDLAVEIAHLDTRAEELQSRIADREMAAEQFIRRIPDDRTQMVFRLRFMRGMTWPEVADVFGGGNSTNGVQKMCYRYLEMNE